MMATRPMPAECVFELPNGWVNSRAFEVALMRCGDALGAAFSRVVIRFPENCALMIDVVLKLLSYCNQLVAKAIEVCLEFTSAGQAILGYLSRVGFFDRLPEAIEVDPYRPTVSGASLYHGTNAGLVEIEHFGCAVGADPGLRDRLKLAVERGCFGRSDGKAVAGSVATIFSELIANVEEHSQTRLDAFAVLQTYLRGDRMTIAVSDSGRGLLNTLRPALQKREPSLARLGDPDLLVEIFRQGISRFDEPGRGCGLMASAAHAIRFKADLDVRLPRTRVLLKPANDAYRPNMAFTQDNLPLLQGTHIAFSLRLS